MTPPAAHPPIFTFTQRCLNYLSRHQTTSAALILLLILHVVFFPFIWGDSTFLASARDNPSIVGYGAWAGPHTPPSPFYRSLDLAAPSSQTEAWAGLIHYLYGTEKTVPLWNPYQAYGAPLAANMQAQPFNPIYLIFALHPTPRTYNLFILLRLFVAGFFTYLFLRFFVSFTPSCAGAASCMLATYYLLYITMPNLSVEIWLPALFFCTELLLRKRNLTASIYLALVVLMVLVGGMPESALLVLSFSYAYYVFRLLSDPDLRPHYLSHTTHLIIANGLGFLLAAPQLLPFLEFMRHSFDTHQAQNIGGVILGAGHDPFGRSITTYIEPLVFGPPWNDITNHFSGHTGVRGAFGVIPLLFAILAIAGIIRRPLAKERKHHLSLVLFFTASTLAILSKRYGNPLVNWMGSLPLFGLIGFPKYEEALLLFCVSALAALGVSAVVEHCVTLSRRVLSLLIVFVIAAAAFLYTNPLIPRSDPHNAYYYTSFAGAFILLGIAATILLIPAAFSRRKSRLWLSSFVVLIVTELSLNYFAPCFYFFNPAASDDASPYAGAPFVDFVKGQDPGGHWRVFGRDLILYPNWSSTYRLEDIRDLDAMYYEKYLPFVRAFFTNPIEPITGERHDRFGGGIDYPFASPRERRLLQLSSVRYILSQRAYLPFSALQSEILAQNAGTPLPLIREAVFTIQGDTKPVLFQHPRSERLPFVTTISPDKSTLSFSLAMDPAVFSGCGAGVDYRLEIKDGAGAIRQLYDRYIDPKHRPEERRWFPEAVDLQRYLGQTVTLLFSALPGPSGDTCAAWGGWGALHFAEDRTAPNFKRIFRGGADVYEYDEVLPRAAIFNSAEVVADDAAILQRLVSPTLDPFQSVVVAADQLLPQDLNLIKDMDELPSHPVSAATIQSYTSREVVIRASLDRSGLLMLNDSNYPGWKVYVDGRPANWIPVDYLFRGVFLFAGDHQVVYRYEPESFRLGATLSGLTVLGLAIYLIAARSRRRLAGSPA